MTFTIRQQAPQHTRYDEKSVEKNVGRQMTLRIPELNESRVCVIKAAEVVDDGRAIDITFVIVPEA